MTGEERLTIFKDAGENLHSEFTVLNIVFKAKRYSEWSKTFPSVLERSFLILRLIANLNKD